MPVPAPTNSAKQLPPGEDHHHTYRRYVFKTKSRVPSKPHTSHTTSDGRAGTAPHGATHHHHRSSRTDPACASPFDAKNSKGGTRRDETRRPPTAALLDPIKLVRRTDSGVPRRRAKKGRVRVKDRCPAG